MPVSSPATLKPRKTPSQARSAATVEAIYAATIQVLLAHGESKLTTTRIAERAGVSIGTMYQYFPDKNALIYAVLQQKLGAVHEEVERAAANLAGLPLIAISDGLVSAWLDAKTRDIAASRALYALASDFDTIDLIGEGSHRMLTAIEKALARAADATFANPGSVAFVMRAILAGTVRSVLERGAKPAELSLLRTELPRVCRAYLLAAAQPFTPGQA